MLPIQRKPHCQNIYMKNPSSAVLILCLSFRGAAWGEFLSVFVSGEDFLWGRIFSGGIVTREEFLGGGTQHINKMRQEISETGDGGKVLTRTDHMLLMRRLVSGDNLTATTLKRMKNEDLPRSWSCSFIFKSF